MNENKPKLERIIIQHITDTDPDTSYLGEYTDETHDWAICWHCGEYVSIAEKPDRRIDEIDDEICDLEDEESDLIVGEEMFDPTETEITRRLDEIRGKMAELKLEIQSLEPSTHNCPRSTREYNFFLPYASGEEEGSDLYQKYGKQDFERMERLNNGSWRHIGIVAKGIVSYDDGELTKRIETFTSSGLWGIESDSDKEYIQEIEQEQLDDLRAHLERFGVDVAGWDEVEMERKEVQST